LSEQQDSIDGAQAEPEAGSESRPRCFTVRAILIGLLLPALVALMGGNFFSVVFDELSKTIVAALLLLGLVVNPLLGHRRLRPGEMVVAMTFALVLSVAMVPTFKAMLNIAGVPQGFATQPSYGVLSVELSEEERDQRRADLLADARLMLARNDSNGDGVLQQAELGSVEQFARLDADADGRVDAEEWLEGELALQPGLLPDERLAVDHRYFTPLWAPGLVDSADPEYRHQVDHFANGIPADDLVRHRSVVTWRIDDGEQQRQIALAGEAKRQALREGRDFLDLDDRRLGRFLRGMRAGQTRSLPDGRSVSVLAIENAGTPWYAWAGPLLMWSPLLVGFLFMMIGLVAVVRRQWIHNERLSFPIGEIMHQFLGPREYRGRLAPLYRNKGFWAGFGIAAFIAIWKGLYVYALIPIDFKTAIDFTQITDGRPWDLLPHYWIMRSFKLSILIVAVAYFMPTDMSFSVWTMFIGANVLCMLLNLGGVAEINARDLSQMSAGGILAMATLIIYIGRHYYGRCLKAAVGLGTPDMRQAAPYIWVIIAGCSLMLLFLVLQGVPVHYAALLILLIFGSVLVFCRLVAEAGFPNPGFPLNVQAQYMFFTITGFGLPMVSLVPLALVGVAFQKLDMGVLHASYLGEKEGVPKHKHHGLMAVAAVGLALLAIVGLLAHHYEFGAWLSRPFRNSQSHGVDVVARGAKVFLNPNSATNDDTAAGGEYLMGALIVFMLGFARMRFARWPLHPLAFLIFTTWTVMNLYFSFFLGWLLKTMVLRYGGTGIYQQTKPVALGLIGGAGVTMVLFAVLSLVGEYYGMDWQFVSV